MSTTAPQAPGITRIDLQRHDLSIPGREVIQNRVEISPEAPAFRHKHPGEEIIYVLEGTPTRRSSPRTSSRPGSRSSSSNEDRRTILDDQARPDCSISCTAV
jgi:hypothetical protein